MMNKKNNQSMKLTRYYYISSISTLILILIFKEFGIEVDWVWALVWLTMFSMFYYVEKMIRVQKEK